MADNTSIEWTDATWNPVRGCSRVSPGCVKCYAERMASRFCADAVYVKGVDGQRLDAEKFGVSPVASKVEPFFGFAERAPSGPRWTGRVELIPHMLDVPLKRRKPTTYFVNSMSDLFHERLSNEDIRRVFQVICECRGRHTFQILTKRAARMREWFAWAKTVEPGWFNERDVLDLWQTWLGVSVEDQQRADERIPDLLATPAAVRFLSVEPLLGLVDLGEYLGCPHQPRGGGGDIVCNVCGHVEAHGASIDWVIVGGESGPGARPCDIAWIRSIVQQCAAAGVACFVKQLGGNPIEAGFAAIRLNDGKGGDMDEWPVDLRVRQMPGAQRA